MFYLWMLPVTGCCLFFAACTISIKALCLLMCPVFQPDNTILTFNSNKHLGVEDSLVVAQVETSALPALPGLPGTCRSHPTAVEPKAVSPGGAAGPPVSSPPHGWSLIADRVTPWEDPALAPHLGLNRLTGSHALRGLMPPGGGRVLPAEDLLHPPPFCSLASSLWPNLACRWPSRARAGARPLPAARMLWGADLKAPRADLAMRLMARWYSPSMPFCPDWPCWTRRRSTASCPRSTEPFQRGHQQRQGRPSPRRAARPSAITPTSTCQDLLSHRDLDLRAARTVDPTEVEVDSHPQQLPHEVYGGQGNERAGESLGGARGRQQWGAHPS